LQSSIEIRFYQRVIRIFHTLYFNLFLKKDEKIDLDSHNLMNLEFNFLNIFKESINPIDSLTVTNNLKEFL
jgi:hypothetical protein